VAPYQGVSFGGSPFWDRRAYRLTDLYDGTSNTMLAAEVRQGIGSDYRGLIWWGDASEFSTFQAPNSTLPDITFGGGCNFPASDNPPCISSNSQPSRYAARSKHPGGVNVVMGDCSVRFVRNNIDINIWRAMSTRNGAEVVTDSD